MELAELGKKIVQTVAPYGILTTVLIGLKIYYQVEITLIDMIVFNIIFGLSCITFWHEMRIRELEGKSLMLQNPEGIKRS